MTGSCSDSTTDPSHDSTNPTDTTGNPTDTAGFAILAATADTLYYGEQAWIDVRDLGTDTSVLRMFIHTVRVEQMTIVGSRLYYTVPHNAPTGKIRLYKGDSLAKNSFTLHVLPHHINFNTTVLGYDPALGYSGETFMLVVHDLPLRRREFDVLWNGHIMNVLAWDTSTIVVEVPELLGDGMLTLRVFDRNLEIGHFAILAHTGRLLDENTLSGVHLQAIQMLGTVRIETVIGDTTVVSSNSPGSFTFSARLKTGVPVVRGDSLFVTASELTEREGGTLDLALLPSTGGRNIVSGRMTLTTYTVVNEVDTVHESTTMTINDMSWRREQGGSYTLYARGASVAQRLTSLSQRSRHMLKGGVEFNETILNYDDADTLSSFMLNLVP